MKQSGALVRASFILYLAHEAPRMGRKRQETFRGRVRNPTPASRKPTCAVRTGLAQEEYVNCCICMAWVVGALGLVAVPTFFLAASLFCISCFADINLSQVDVRSLVWIWVCVTCCIGSACVVLVLGLVVVPVFFPPAFFCWSQIRWYKFIVGCCERSGLHFGMRDMLQWGGLCCAWACRGSNIFLPASLLLDLMSRWYLFVAGCCKRFDLYLGMRDVLHLWGLCCGCPLFCCGSIFFSPRAPFWGSHFSLISTCGNLLWTDRSAFGYASRFAFVRLVVCLLGLAAAPVFSLLVPIFGLHFSLISVCCRLLWAVWSALGYAGHAAFVWRVLYLSWGLSWFQHFFLSRPFAGSHASLITIYCKLLWAVWSASEYAWHVAFVWRLLCLRMGLFWLQFFLLGPFLWISCLADTRML